MNDEAVIADHYRRYRPLARPAITWRTFFARAACVLLASLVISLVAFSAMAAYRVIEWGSFPFSYFLRIYALIAGGICLLFHKIILITCIELYQHYAPEHIRRKCICMPSCSVYATMALKKYNTFKAVHLILSRLERCCGTICYIDFP